MFENITEELIKSCDKGRWEAGIPHHHDSVALYKLIEHTDFEHFNDSFCFKSGGDGDNGETLMYILDTIFEARDKATKQNEIRFSCYSLIQERMGWKAEDYSFDDYKLERTIFVVGDAPDFDTKKLVGISDIVIDKENFIIFEDRLEGPDSYFSHCFNTRDILGDYDNLQYAVDKWIRSRCNRTYSLAEHRAMATPELFEFYMSLASCSKIDVSG
jgi:hypothetical protein